MDQNKKGTITVYKNDGNDTENRGASVEEVIHDKSVNTWLRTLSSGGREQFTVDNDGYIWLIPEDPARISEVHDHIIARIDFD